MTCDFSSTHQTTFWPYDDNGVFQFLLKAAKEAEERPPFTLSASSERTSGGTNEDVLNVVQPGKTWWASENLPGQWLFFGFPRHYLKLSVIRFHCYSTNFPKKWVLLARNAESDRWTRLREYGEDARYGQNSPKVTQAVNAEQPFRYFKIEANGPMWSATATDQWFLNYIELFGTLYDPRALCDDRPEMRASNESDASQ
jgi:hypothetical protein